MFNSTIKNVIGDFIWYFIYIILPVLIVVILLIVRFSIEKRWKTTLIYSLILTVIYLSAITITPIAVNRYIQTFSTQKWIQYKYERKLMLNDLNQKIELIGMTVTDIKNLLGVPDAESDHDIEYVIDSGWVDPEMLVLRFEEQKVVEVYRYTEFKPQK